MITTMILILLALSVWNFFQRKKSKRLVRKMAVGICDWKFRKCQAQAALIIALKKAEWPGCEGAMNTLAYVLTQNLTTPEGAMIDGGSSYSGSGSVIIEDEAVPANGASANVVAAVIPASGLKIIALLSTVPCTVTLTGSSSAPVLVANVLTTILTLNANVTSISIGANSVGAGAAGTIKIRALYDATP